MIESMGLPPTAQALFTIGLVLAEAVVLYVGYGIVEQRAAPILFETLKSN